MFLGAFRSCKIVMFVMPVHPFTCIAQLDSHWINLSQNFILGTLAKICPELGHILGASHEDLHTFKNALVTE
jgi:hypothetical protein